MNKDKDKLKDWEENFINIYFNNGGNGTEAYVLARPGISYDAAKVNASKLLTKTNIQKRIAEKNIEIRSREEIKLGDLVAELKRLINDCKTDERVDRVNMLKALDQLSKIGGFYTQTIKNDITIKGDQPLFFGPTHIDEDNGKL